MRSTAPHENRAMKLADYRPQEPLSPAGTAYGVECWQRGEDVAGAEFAFGADPYQRLLVFRSPKPDGRVLLFWHGGGWTSGYKEWMSFMAPALTGAGVTFVSAGYRLAPQHVFPAGLEDCTAAVAWVVREIVGHGGDPDQLFIGGHSAGGHYAALLSVNGRALASRKLPRSTVRGCLPLSGVFDFGPASGLSMRPRFLGADPGNDAAASAIMQIETPLPPFLIAFGSNDFPHLIPQARAFAAAVRAAGGEAETIEMAGRTHFTASFAGGEPDGPWVPAALAFMSRHAGVR
jgi:arylformamidase